jgi:hypothetical protein
MTTQTWHTLLPERQRAVVELLHSLARQWREEARLEGESKGASRELLAAVSEMAAELDAAADRLDPDAPRALAPLEIDKAAPQALIVDGALDLRFQATLIEIGSDRRGRSVVRLRTRHGPMRVPMPVSHSFARALARHLYEPVSVTVTINPRTEPSQEQGRSP